MYRVLRSLILLFALVGLGYVMVTPQNAVYAAAADPAPDGDNRPKP